ncbi:DoxX family protein [Pedobacter agri]|uniref:DoxX family protein n=1 Tax=Pedobacter agri TaxID=454586 RepID=UPI002930568C|nr:DoxX family protein [Pedobacter agri]
MKKRKVIGNILLDLITVISLSSGFLKVIRFPWSVDGLVKFNLPHAAIILGLMEMTFAILFLFPKTLRIGFILLSCYYAGAMATELSHDGSMLNPGIPLMLLWLTAFIRDRQLFSQISSSNVS